MSKECKWGHDLSENTYVRADGRTECLTCRRIRRQVRYRRLHPVALRRRISHRLLEWAA